MADAAETLSLAWFFTTNETYAVKAAGLLRTWFLDSGHAHESPSRIRPGHPRCNTGRGIGIIETRALMRVVDCAGLLADSKAWSQSDQAGLEKWFDRYLQWMLESKYAETKPPRKTITHLL